MSTIWKRLKAGLGHAFAVSQKEEAWRPEEIALMEKIALKLVRRGMAEPAVLFLESLAPLNFLGSQALHALIPLLGLACNPLELERMASILEKRNSIAFFIEIIEQLEMRDRRRESGGPTSNIQHRTSSIER